MQNEARNFLEHPGTLPGILRRKDEELTDDKYLDRLFVDRSKNQKKRENNLPFSEEVCIRPETCHQASPSGSVQLKPWGGRKPMTLDEITKL